ncbi:ATP-binding cassette domain-containing protein [Priestia sp. 179-F W1.4 NHS]|uniref:ABC transporter ATP-binding protein n=1 Tax=Priestia sp. 179-F W1.4 NHS TaxID=3374296 RepID=UPI00387A6B2D
MYAIETSKLTKKYGSKTIVNSINLQVPQGEIYGFLGRNGAGKSTFINMLTGVSFPSAGEFTLLGQSDIDLGLQKKIGVLPDYATFYDEMTALNHLRYFLKINGHRFSKEHCSNVLKKVGLEGHDHQKVGKFSFGMKKKLGIAQAIVTDPDLIFLDEPTSGVDIESALHIHELIRELQNQGKTIFMTSHNLNEVEKICTRVAIMKNGVILVEGTMEELRFQYQAKKTVMIKHDPYPSSHKEYIQQFFRTVSPDVEYHHTYTKVMLQKERNIPLIIRELIQCGIDIYQIHVEEPSLEEIFLQKNIVDHSQVS